MNRWYAYKVMAVLALIASLMLGNALAMEVSSYFSDNMVLQRDKPVKVWGTGKSGEKVTVTFAGQSKTAPADKDGKWVVALDPMPANAKGSELKVTSPLATRPSTLSNILVGDVWFFGRQTYVDISLGRTDEGKAAASKFKPAGEFRAIVIKTAPAKEPQDDLAKDATSGWMQVDGKNALGMSAAAFYLGADLTKELGVPVGVVDVNMDRYFAIGWLSTKALEDSATLNPKREEHGIAVLPQSMRQQAQDRDSGKAQKELDEYYAEMVQKNPKAVKPLLGLHPLRNPMYPSAGYNAIINPLKNMTVKGILLQLGNDYPFVAYRELEKAGLLTTKAGYDSGWEDSYMILKAGYYVTPVTLPYVPGDWRRTFGDADLPMGLILPPSSKLDVYAAHNREIRELDRRTAEGSENIGLIMPGNDNIPLSGQPADDRLLAERCKQWVLGAVVGKTGVAATGPIFDRLDAKLGKGTIYFKAGTAEDLKANGDSLNQFETAGPDRVFTPAKASIDGPTIKLKSDGPIQFARYNWNGRPDQGLVNGGGLPALPFSTDTGWEFDSIPPPEEPNLPEEYVTTADKWSQGDVAIINGRIANTKDGDSAPIPHRPGPIGIVSARFGPNLYVVRIDPDTPAEGKILPGDVIYGANGKVFDDSPGVPYDAQYHVLSEAITYSESEEGEGKLVLSLRRGTKTMDVDIQLQVLGSYSSTTPYYCEKSQNIVKNAEEWMTRQYRPASGVASEPTGMLRTDMLFMLAAGDPEYQGLVRRAVYSMMAKMDPKPVSSGMTSTPWHTGHDSLLLGEYFQATGDRNVLPYLKYLADLSAESQLKPASETPADKEAAQTEEQVGGWRQNYPGSPDRWKSGYGLMMPAAMSCVMGMELAKEAGLDIDDLALERGLTHLNEGRAEYGFVVYGYRGLRREGPEPMDPEAEAKGLLWSMNGKLGMAASLFNMVDDKDTVDICARFCVYGFNNTRSGHGGMFFNNFWTPIGAWAGGEKAFKHFMKGQTWWRELYRRSDGAFNQVGRGHIGVSYAIAHVAPKQRLRILGGPKSAFGTNCPEYLEPAIEAHKTRDYALCETLILKQLNESITPPEDMPVVNHLLDDVQTLRASIAYDLDYTEKRIEQGKYYYASLELPQLKGIVAADNPRLNAIVAQLDSPEGLAKIQEHRNACNAEKRAMAKENEADAAAGKQENWIGLIPVEGSRWQMKIVEDISDAPERWTEPLFDDSAWNTATLPISWTMYHTALFRSTLNVDDTDVIDALRILGGYFQQANVVIYLNGEVVAKIDDIGGGIADAQLTDYAMKLLKKGENTIAISSRHKRRWGSYRGTYKTAATVSFWVEGREAK